MFYLCNLWSWFIQLSCACFIFVIYGHVCHRYRVPVLVLRGFVLAMAGGIESEGYGCVVNIMGMFVLSAFSGGMGWNPIEYD